MSDERLDLVIRGATIFDGAGNAPLTGDVGISGARIVEVGTIARQGAREIDGRGLALAPGFIDVHSHDDFAVFATPEMDFKVMQGVTTDVVGNCGMAAAPGAVARSMFRSWHAGASIPDWDDYEGYLATIDRVPPSLNVAVLVGHGTLRLAAMEDETRAPHPHELDAMRHWLGAALDAGAVGLSTGLIYEPGRYAKTEEIVALAQEIAVRGGLYASHMRDEAAGLLDSVRETITIGEQAGVPVQISHHKASGKENWGKVRESLALVDEARGRGIDVNSDQYPYCSGSTSLAAVLQNDAFGAGRGGIGLVPAEGVLFASMPKHPEREGRRLCDYCSEWGLSAAGAAERIVKEEGAGAVVVVDTMHEDDVRTVMRHPATMIGSDGIATGSRPHPRLYGTFARVLGRYTRDEKVLTLAEAIHRMTGMAATKFRLEDRGYIRPGYFADLVLFDPEKIADKGTYDSPREYPAGVNYVFVNGTAVVADGQHTGARPGRGLRRG
ncbi:MAG TPA: D-aminoacylase [Candidatus Binataceae bacterium]|nr:D-aminoacylase [Candidatus Binataceae bacterium]